jgi:tetratricopeptide (TPR) repeat protein
LEPSLADLSNGLSLDEVVRVYERWFRKAPRGISVLVYQGEPARREFLNKLAGRLKTLRFVDLSRGKDVQAVVEIMASALESSDSVVFSGFEEAVAPTPEAARIFNYNRERLASFGARQLWVVGPLWQRALRAWAFDLYSWFLPNNTIGSVSPDVVPKDLREFEKATTVAAGPVPSQVARRSVFSLLGRFQRAYQEQGKVEWSLLNGAMDSLLAAGAYPASYDLLARAQYLVAEVRKKPEAESPEALRDLSVSLNKVGDAQAGLGRRDEALASYQESLGIFRRLLDVYGESAEALRDLSVSLEKVGNAQRDLGQRDEALASNQESLGIRRRLLDVYGESAEALRDLSVSLNRVGNVQEDLGRRDEALAGYQESLGIRRRLLDTYGESAEALRDLSVSLNNVGDAQGDLGRRDEAFASYQESLGIRRRLLDGYGESPQALRDLSVSLNNVGDAQGDLGRRDEALAGYQESLGIARRLLDTYGESPQALRDLSVSLDRVGNVQEDLGRRDEARAGYQESLGIRRRLLDTYGESPQALRDIAVSCGWVTRSNGDDPAGRITLNEGAQAIERAIALFGERSDLLSVREWLQGLYDV